MTNLHRCINDASSVSYIYLFNVLKGTFNTLLYMLGCLGSDRALHAVKFVLVT